MSLRNDFYEIYINGDGQMQLLSNHTVYECELPDPNSKKLYLF
jgi:hypothetical protein